MPKAVLHGCTIAVAGNFGKDRDPVSLKRWIDSNGGKWAGTKVEPGVTHLICSAEAYKTNNTAVQKAEELKVPLVTYDWLEDSLQNRHRYKAQGKYAAKNAYKMSAREKAERKKREKKVLKEDGSSARDPESYGGIAAAFLERHLDNLEGKGDAQRKPDVEEYRLWEKVGKEQGGEVEKSVEGGDGDGDTAMSDGGAASSLNGADRTPSFESNSPRDSASPTRAAPPCLKTTPAPMSASQLAGQPITPPSKISHTPVTPPDSKMEALRERLGYGSSPAFKTPPPLPPIRPRLRYAPADPTPDVDNHHLYRDATGFTYDIILLRLELAKNTNERFAVRLYESNTTPHTCAVHVRFMSSLKKRVLSPSVKAMGVLPEEGVTVAAVGSSWEVAFREFRGVFRHLTGLEWEERLDAVKAGRVRPSDGHGDGEVERYFKYMRPKDGEPRGLFPPGANKGLG